MKESTDTDYPVDAVITWVDGYDPVHMKKMNDWLISEGAGAKPFSTTRYSSIGEVNYCVKSILKFAPFIRTIYIVTDNQVPDIYHELSKLNSADSNKIVIVDHKDIFKGHEQHLPTFNCWSIEIMMTRIPGAAEHIVYFNDDILLLKPVKKSDWFIDGRPVIRGKWKVLPSRSPVKIFAAWIRKLTGKSDYYKRAGYGNGQVNAAVCLGFTKRYLRIHHTPSPMRCSTLNKFLDENPGVLETNLRYRTRHYSQYVVQSLANNLEIKNGSAVIREDYQLLHMPSYRLPPWYLRLKLAAAERNSDIIFGNFQSLELASQDKIDIVFNWLDRLLFKNP